MCGANKVILLLPKQFGASTIPNCRYQTSLILTIPSSTLASDKKKTGEQRQLGVASFYSLRLFSARIRPNYSLFNTTQASWRRLSVVFAFPVEVTFGRTSISEISCLGSFKQTAGVWSRVVAESLRVCPQRIILLKYTVSILGILWPQYRISWNCPFSKSLDHRQVCGQHYSTSFKCDGCEEAKAREGLSSSEARRRHFSWDGTGRPLDCRD